MNWQIVAPVAKQPAQISAAITLAIRENDQEKRTRMVSALQ